MRIVIATDGTIEAQPVAELVGKMASPGDSAIVFTAVNVPTEFLKGLGDRGITEAARIAHEAGQTLGAGDKAAERMSREAPAQPSRSGVDSPVASALEATARTRTQPLADALSASGVQTSTRWLGTENKTARTIMVFANSVDADLIVIGSHGHGRFEGFLGSTGTKVVRHADQAVLVMRTRQKN